MSRVGMLSLVSVSFFSGCVMIYIRRCAYVNTYVPMYVRTCMIMQKCTFMHVCTYIRTYIQYVHV